MITFRKVNEICENPHHLNTYSCYPQLLKTYFSFSKKFHFIALLLSWFLPSEVSPYDLITSYFLKTSEPEVELSKDSEEKLQRPTSAVLTVSSIQLVPSCSLLQPSNSLLQISLFFFLLHDFSITLYCILIFTLL